MPSKKTKIPANPHISEESQIGPPPVEAVDSPPADAEIAEVAYQLWLQGGCRTGHDLEDWYRAVVILRESPRTKIHGSSGQRAPRSSAAG